MSEQSSGRVWRLPPEAIAAIVVAALCGIALYIRIELPYERIFINDWIWFRETDAYYYLRHIENLVHNFPRFNTFDPYMLYPGGGEGLTRPMFAWLVAGAIRLFVGASPTLHQIASVSAYMPAILGTLTLVPVYFIGRELFSRWAGVLAAALLAILPGEFLHRSLLGFTDHHVAEALLSATAVLFLIMAVKRAREREICFGHLLARDWSTIRKPLVYTLLAGVFLGFYLLSWQGGLLFIFIMFTYLAVQFVVDHLRGRLTDYLCIIGSPLFLIAFLMLLPVMGEGWAERAYWVALPFAILVPVVLSVISRLLSGKSVKPAYYPMVLAGVVGIVLVALLAINPDLLRFMLRQFGIFAPEGAHLTVLEIHPLTIQIAWANFTTSFFISFIALAVLAFVTVRERSAEKTVFLVWCVVMLAAVLGQRRFGYYFAVNVALLTGYFSWKVLDLAGLNKLLSKSKQAVAVAVAAGARLKKKEAREKARARRTGQAAGAWAKVSVAGVAIFFIVFFPNFGMVRGLAGGPHFIGQWLGEGWESSCIWLRDHTPEPFGDPEFYYESYGAKADFEYPDTAYGVMSWWDYGYFITQIGRRVPNANPTQSGAVEAGRFFTAQDEGSANEVADARGVKYVMIDHMMATSKFYAMAEWAEPRTGRGLSEFQEYFGVPPGEAGGNPQWVGQLYYPAYYQSTVARLYNFDGKQVSPSKDSAVVIPWSGEAVWRGIRYKIIVAEPEHFDSYEEALAHVAAQESGQFAIGGLDRFESPVTLEELAGYELVHESDARISMGDRVMPGVKVFEYLGHSGS
ncbi:MAG: oligosaccharyl transferase, archaeosortase A system-associated [Dehalococcoidia bacterium]